MPLELELLKYEGNTPLANTLVAKNELQSGNTHCVNAEFGSLGRSTTDSEYSRLIGDGLGQA